MMVDPIIVVAFVAGFLTMWVIAIIIDG